MKISVKSSDAQESLLSLCDLSFTRWEKETLAVDLIEGDMHSKLGLQLAKGIMNFLRGGTSIELQIIPAIPQAVNSSVEP